MDYTYIHPREQLASFMERIYGYGMTTTSGGNLSILDDTGDLWITPGGTDKGSLGAGDITRIKKNGTVRGKFQPSSELPFHKAIYAARPDVKAILHAHPPALISFSIARTLPDVRIIPQAYHICGAIGYAPYACPGSKELGDVIATTFSKGHDIVLLENHGIVTVGETLLQAFLRFETIDFCARSIIKAALVGKYRILSESQLAQFTHWNTSLPEFTPSMRSSKELSRRQKACSLVHRAYNQQLMTSTEGTVSTRLDSDCFIITPNGFDRKRIEPADMVLINQGKQEQGKQPSRAVNVHRAIYAHHPSIKAIFNAHPPNISAYLITGKKLDTRIIPESYLCLRDIPYIPFGAQFNHPERITDAIGTHSPVVMIENDCIISTGTNLLEAYDRLEVAEFSAKAILNTHQIGKMVPIAPHELADLERTFFNPSD